MKRKLLILILGIGFLILMTVIATSLDSIIPHHPTPPTQVVQAGPYQITLQVSPNPPHITAPATLTFQVARPATHQLITAAHLTLESSMPSMVMDPNHSTAQLQSDGTYLAHVQFSMSGSWQLTVVLDIPGAPTQRATFQITAQ